VKHAVELHRRRIPLHLLLIDAVGAALAAVGVFDLLQTGPQFVPTALQFPGVGIALVATGSLLMLPVPVWLLRRHRQEHPRQGSRP
jgi:hypothetical protein